MGQQIIKQPDGRFAIFSTAVDKFVVVDATPEELIEWRAQQAADEARVRTKLELDAVGEGKRPYLQFTLTWEKAREIDPDGLL